MTRLTLTQEDLDSWELPDTRHLTEANMKQFEDRRKAFRSVVVVGRSIAAAAKAHGLNRHSLTKALKDAQQIGPDGKPWGWRACIPHRVQTASEAAPSLPDKPGPGAFTKLVRAIPTLAAWLLTFTKMLPTRERRSSAFENFFERFLTEVRRTTQGKGYPFNASDRGRRALLSYLKQLREQTPNLEQEAEESIQASARQLNEVFAFDVMERLEFDEHRMDCDFVVEVEDKAGRTTLRNVSYVWLLLLIDSTSRLILAHTLVIGRSFTQIDVVRTFSAGLLAWQPRELIAPDMRYVADSGVGTMAAVERVLRGIISAADNALSHIARFTKSTLSRYFRGVLSFGHPRVPETRGILEALFRKLEDGAIRHIPGGYEPARGRETPKRRTTSQAATDHPLNLVALNDLLDVIVAGYNATPLASLGNRSPLDVIRHFKATSAWWFESSRSEDDAKQLTLMRLNVTIKGRRKSKDKGGRQPYVQWLHGRYRAFGLRDRWDLIGQSFAASVWVEDVREMTLYTEKGEVFVRLRALPPWSATRQDYDLRRLIHRWSARGLFSIAGVNDAVAAYRTFVKTNAATIPAAADHVAKYPHFHASPDSTVNRQKASVFVPRSGPVTFDEGKDPAQ